MKNKSAKILKYILMSVPLFIGIWGFWYMDGRPFLQSVYQTCQLYLFCGEPVVPNILVEIARWAAPVATASSLILIINYLRRSFFNRFAYLKGQSTAVYGPEKEKTALLKQLGTSGINGTDKFVKADRYILLDSEEKNLEFFDKNRQLIGNKEVYANCDSLSAQAVAYHNLRLFCAEERSASVFWKEHCIYSLSKAKGHHLDIVFIGFEKLGKELLLSAVQNNIFSPQQQINYHIFGKPDGFKNIYHQLDSISDKVEFYAEEWHEHTQLINNADMVIVLQQDKQPQLLRELLLATSCPSVHLFCAADYSTDILDNNHRIVAFNWKKAASTLDNILEIALFKKAKQGNMRYNNKTAGIAETPQNTEELWQQLNTFLRYSNISAADYNDVQRIMVKTDGYTFDNLPAEAFELLSQLEHIRWCRYYYLNNWMYGETADGKKDSVKRIHPYLVSYEQLDEPIKQLDRNNVELFFRL